MKKRKKKKNVQKTINYMSANSQDARAPSCSVYRNFNI
jgi:hypothetical protein